MQSVIKETCWESACFLSGPCFWDENPFCGWAPLPLSCQTPCTKPASQFITRGSVQYLQCYWPTNSRSDKNQAVVEWQVEKHLVWNKNSKHGVCVSLFSPSLVEQNLKCLEGLLIFQNHTYPVVRKAAQENLTGLKNWLYLSHNYHSSMALCPQFKQKSHFGYPEISLALYKQPGLTFLSWCKLLRTCPLLPSWV